MNLLGKIFVVLILVMSLVFLGFSVSVLVGHTNWRLEANRPQTDVKPGESLGLRHQLTQVIAANTNLQKLSDDLRAQLTAEQTSINQQRKRLLDEIDVLKREYKDQLDASTQLIKDERENVELTERREAALSDKYQELALLEAEAAKAAEDRDRTLKDLVAVSDGVSRFKGDATGTKADNIGLAEEKARAKVALNRRGIDIEAPVDAIPTKLDGIVLKSSKEGLVEISLGSDAGLRAGHQLIVYRQSGAENKFLGKIVILTTLHDKSVGRVIPEFRKGPIEKEDRVATRLN